MARKLKLSDSFDQDDEAETGAPAAPVHSQIATAHRDTRGDLIAQAVVPLETRAQYVQTIAGLWGTAQNAFVEIGRHLNNAKVRIAHGEFMAMIDAELPFGDRVANKLMAVARAIDDAVFPAERLPNSYSTIYELIMLPEDGRHAAMRENVVRPDVTREEILSFKRRWRTKDRSEPDSSALRKRLRKLLADRERLDEEIALLRKQIGEGDGSAP